MAKRKFKFAMKVSIESDHTVEIDEDEVPAGQDIEDYANEIANQTWDYVSAGKEEKFNQYADLIGEVTGEEEE